MTTFTMRTQRGQPRRTRIVCTLGPATSTREAIGSLFDAGLNVARINCSHGKPEDRAQLYKLVREVAAELGAPAGVLFDLAGPKIRVSAIKDGGIDLERGSTLTFVRGAAEGTREAMTSIYPALIDDLNEGDPVFLDDGNLRLRVVRKEADRAECRVEMGGRLTSRKGINLPGSKVSAPPLTEKDIEDVRHAVELGADFIALSFVRTPGNVRELRSRLNALGADNGPRIVSKIETPQAIDELDAIVAESDAVMVARGDLGVEMPVERIPGLQRTIILSCRRALKPVIVATQVLESMIHNARPTRAEVSDIAHAIEQGCDALMLSAETASGEYPAEAVNVMSEVARDTETALLAREEPAAFVDAAAGDPLRKAMVRGADEIARALKAKFIVVRSSSGETGRYFSKLRGGCPIVAASPDERVLRRHALDWGVIPMRTGGAGAGDVDSMEGDIAFLCRELLRQRLVFPSDHVVVVGRFPWGESLPPNNIRAVRVGDALDIR